MTTETMTRAQTFNALRKELGWKLAECARRLDTYPATVGQWAARARHDDQQEMEQHAASSKGLSLPEPTRAAPGGEPSKMALAFLRLHLAVRETQGALAVLSG